MGGLLGGHNQILKQNSQLWLNNSINSLGWGYIFTLELEMEFSTPRTTIVSER